MYRILLDVVAPRSPRRLLGGVRNVSLIPNPSAADEAAKERPKAKQVKV